jgi:hypothetical protein
LTGENLSGGAFMTIKRGEPLLATDITDLTFFPKGTILTFSSEAWSATGTEFKSIWKICNGQNGTPNLVNKFLRGAESSGNVNSQNGTMTLETKHLPAHKHSITDKEHGHTIYNTQTGNNDVVWIEKAGSSHRMSETGSVGRGTLYIKPSGTGITETNDSINGGESFDVIPDYYTVIYIIKVV